MTASIGIEPSVYDGRGDVCYTYDRTDLKNLLPARDLDAHKGNYGKVLLIVGSPGMAGAAYFSAKAAYLTGAGLVQIIQQKRISRTCSNCFRRRLLPHMKGMRKKS